jgi:hypothetical protein
VSHMLYREEIHQLLFDSLDPPESSNEIKCSKKNPNCSFSCLPSPRRLISHHTCILLFGPIPAADPAPLEPIPLLISNGLLGLLLARLYQLHPGPEGDPVGPGIPTPKPPLPIPTPPLPPMPLLAGRGMVEAEGEPGLPEM